MMEKEFINTFCHVVGGKSNRLVSMRHIFFWNKFLPTLSLHFLSQDISGPLQLKVLTNDLENICLLQLIDRYSRL